MAECSSRRLVHPFDAAWPRPRESVRPLPSTSRSNDRQREIATFSAPPGTARDVSDVLLFQSRPSRPSTRSSPPFRITVRINDLLSIDFPRWKVRGMSADPKEIESGDKGLNRRAETWHFELGSRTKRIFEGRKRLVHGSLFTIGGRVRE